MKRAALLMIVLLAACSSLSDSSWFIIEGISLPGGSDATGTMTVDLSGTTVVTADLHLRNSGAAPGTSRGSGIRGFTIEMGYRFPGTTYSLPGFSQTVVGYLEPPEGGDSTTTVLGGVALLSAERVSLLRSWGASHYTMYVDLRVSGKTDEGASVSTAGEMTIQVIQ